MRYRALVEVQEDLQQSLEAFLATTLTSMSAHTVRAHRATLQPFLTWWTLRDESLEQPVRLSSYLDSHPTWSATTCRNTLSRLHRFLVFLGHPLEPELPFELLRLINQRQDRSVRPVASTEIERIFAHIPDDQARDAVFFRLLYLGALRISEATLLTPQDVGFIDTDTYSCCRLQIQRTLRNETCRRQVEIYDQDFITRMRRYLQTRPSPIDRLFQPTRSETAHPLRQQNLYKRWRQYTDRAGIRCSLEQLRISGLRMTGSVQGEEGEVYGL